MTDVTHQISEVRRTVGKRVLEAGEASVVTVSRLYPADLDDVWDACTTPSRIQRWFLPVEGELRLGGRYQLVGNAGGVVERCDPPKGFAATWEFGGEVSWIELSLTPEGDGTRFSLEHVAHVDDERAAEFGPGAVGIGWDSVLLGLFQHLTSPETAIKPSEAIAWLSSVEGKAFVTASSEDWYRANVESGADPEAARAAADRCTAAYTAASPEA